MYRFIKYGRCVENPTRKVVIYEQLYDSKLQKTGEKIEKGTIWIREKQDFEEKFIKIV